MSDISFQKNGKEYIAPDAFYRVSLKLLVRNDEGKFLLIKDDKGRWGLPGGGWDYGEDYETALRREIQEELGVGISTFESRPIGFYDGASNYNKYRSIKIIFKGYLDSHDFTQQVGEADEVRYVSPEEMNDLHFDEDEVGIVELAKNIVANETD